MIYIEITTDDCESWIEPYHGSADQARAALVGTLADGTKIVRVERVDSKTH